MPLIRLKNFLILSLIAILLFLVSCEYIPEGENIVVIDDPVKNQINIDLGLVSDTIILLKRTQFTINIDIGNYSAQQMQVLVDDKYLNNFYDNKFIFELSPDYYSSGVHKIKVAVKTNTGSNSLDEIYGDEAFLFEKEWFFVVDKNQPAAVKITDFKVVNGSLRICWEKCAGYNFSRYILLKRIYSENQLGYIECTGYSTTNQNKIWFNDSTYVGDKVTYQIGVRGLYKDDVTWGSVITYQHEKAKVSNPYICLDSVSFIWNKSPFTANFSSYRLSYFVGGFTWQTVFESTNLNDTSYTVRESVLGRNKYKLEIVPKYDKVFHSNYEIGFLFNTKVGKTIQGYDRFCPIDENRVSFSGWNSVWIYDLQENVVLKTYNAQQVSISSSMQKVIFDVSQKGNYLGYLDRGTIYIINPKTLELINTITPPSQIDNSFTCINLTLSDLGFGIAYYKQVTMSSSGPGYNHVFDLRTGRTVALIDNIAYYSDMDFSVNGDYFYITTTYSNTKSLYKLENDTINFIYDLPSQYKNLRFAIDANEQFLNIANAKISYYSIKDLSVTKEILLPISFAYGSYSYDMIKGNFLFMESGWYKFRIIDPNNSTILKDVSWGNFSYYPYITMNIHNNYVFSSYFTTLIKL